MLIEIHVLQNHAPSNLNRDDTGSPKECVFGGFKRARISSQCLKRSIRRSNTFQEALQGHLATRTRQLPELIRARFTQEGLNDYADNAAKKASGFGTAKGHEQKPKDGKFSTAQTMFLTSHDIEAVTEVLLKAAREAGSVKKFEALKTVDLQKEAQQKGFRPVSVDVALFGRMTTSEAFRDVEASMQVAHALSTHKVDHEFDYFTAVDDLKNTGDEGTQDDAGADMLGDVEYNSACYYKYFSLDVDGLIANLTGESARRKDIPTEEQQQARALAAQAVQAFVRAMTLTTPSGKQNSFAAHQLPAAVLVEVRPYSTPVSYANAFVKPARPGSDGDLMHDSLSKFGKHVQSLTGGFSLQSTSRLLLSPEYDETTFNIGGVERVPNLNTLCSRLRETVNGDGDGGAVEREGGAHG
ncbi:MAG TPA: type I-E CRISPR-associated protein Cas7/Cse4/CasC [Abditibacteriaceae bacterium]|jgi:CRISPR system Cascade subunit CasC